MEKLWKFEWDSDYSFIGGLFVATDEEVKNIIGKEVNLIFGGKYIEAQGTIEEGEITPVSDNPIVVEAVGNFGLNPLEFLENEDEY